MIGFRSAARLREIALGRDASPRAPSPVAPGEVAAGLDGVSVVRGQRTVLDNVHLELHAGEVVALCGPNGAGKSTLLEALAGDLPVAHGDVALNGVPIGSWTSTEAAMRRAVVLQRHAVAFDFSVVEIVAMGRAPWAATDRADNDRAAVASALDRLEVTHLAARPFATLSGGERARVMLARALAQDAGVLLLDEPTAALDIRHQEQVLELIRRCAGDGVAVVVVVHDLTAAAAVADRMVLLHDGRIEGLGRPAAVLDGEILSRTYAHGIEVIGHPRTGRPLVLPRRDTPD